MPIKIRQELYDLFATGKKPTQDDFADLIDSMINITDDGIGIAEKGQPMEIIEQGDQKRLLDFSSGPNNQTWRINAQSANGSIYGLNISSNEQSRIFIQKEDGLTGINNDAPAAKLHITPDAGEKALQVDKANKSPALIIGENGEVSIGANLEDSAILTVNSTANLNGNVNINGVFNVTKGMKVDGAVLQVLQGLTVSKGASIESGLKVSGGLTVNGILNANGGAVVNESLAVNKKLTVTGDATFQTGILTANAGMSVNGAELKANSGLAVSGALLTANNGLTVTGELTSNGKLLANKGLTVNNSTLDANGQVTLGNATSGNVTANGRFTANKGIILDDSLFQANKGIIISAGDVNVENKLNVDELLSANGGLNVNDSSLEASGQVILGNSDDGNVLVKGVLKANKGIIVSGETLRAQVGAVVTGTELKAESGLRVKNGAIIETGLLTVNEGVSLANNSSFNANGLVSLGNPDKGVVTANGKLQIVNGAIISGANLEVQSGLHIDGTFDALGVSHLETVNIQNLSVADINVTGNLGLTAINLESLNAVAAIIGNLSTEGELSVSGDCTVNNELNVYGGCKVTNDVVLANGKICVTYEGAEGVTPKVIIKKETVTGETGHFDIAINADKQVTITYDDSSDIANFINDWQIYLNTHVKETEGFDFQRVGSGLGRLKEEVIELTQGETAFKEYRIPNNGLRIIYTGSAPGIPQYMITANTENLNSNVFDFVIRDLALGIFYPSNIADRTVKKLLDSWSNWKNINPEMAACFEIRQAGDKDWQLNDILEVRSFAPIGDIVREFKLGELTISNTSNVQNQPGIIIAAAAPGFETGVGIAVSIDKLNITLGTVNNTPKAVYNAWTDWVKNGNETYGFEIAETSAVTPIQIVQQENLVSTDETHSQIEAAGISVTYTGNEAGKAQVLFREGSSNGFSFSIDDVNKQITINYPKDATKRTVTNLLTAWENVAEKYGFGISSSGDTLLVQRAETMGTVIAVIKEYQPTTRGVDNITIRYTGLEADAPGVIIQPNNSNNFTVSISQDKVLTIRYPQDKSGTIDGLLSYWEGLTPADRNGFSFIKYEIKNALVNENSANLDVNAKNKIFSRGIIRTNTVTIDGNLKFGDSNIEISSISKSETLVENSDSVLSTQKAVKAYIDAGMSKKADQTAVDAALALKANVTALNLKADKTALDLKADKTALDLKADAMALNLKADKTALDLKADKTALDLKADKTALDLKADATATLNALSTKSGLVKPVALNLEIGTAIGVDNILLTVNSRGILMVKVTMANVAKVGLFAIYGADSIIKISGDGMSDQQGNSGTWNVYANAGEVMIQNASTETIVAQVTYFGE